tara:strand:+ start:1753 stop:2913 length:1161 start_codon:yes stop_codon:yes gene_type:complete
MTAFSPEGPARVFLLDGAALLAARRRVYDGDPALAVADQRLLLDAEAARAVGPFSVIDKPTSPPSGDMQDYLSQGPYWWPDPKSADGLPWVRRDGEANPDRELHDRHALAAMLSAVNTLAAAFYFSEHEDFAESAGLLLRTWFIDPQTRMNPHLQFAQGIPGRCEGRGIGIIDTAQIGFLIDSIGLLGGAAAWTGQDQQALLDWMTQFLAWLLESDHGVEEAVQANNHGTWYDVQVLSLALFTRNEDVYRQVTARGAQRINAQIEADGAQPFELSRTKSLDYSVMNLTGLFDLADLSGHCGVDLWRHEGEGGRSLRRAVDWLVANGIDSEWIRPQIEPFDSSRWLPLLRRSAQHFGDPRYSACISRLPDIDEASAERIVLLYPEPQ